MSLHLPDIFKYSEVRSIAPDSPELAHFHREILSHKPMVREVFQEFYDRMRVLDETYFGSTPGLRIELGSGSSIMKEFYPEVISSDYKKIDGLDRILDATQMDLPDRSVRAFYGINCFHHFPDPNKFFGELMRTLNPGGGAVLIEPYHGPFSSWLHQRMHSYEFYDKTQKEWINPHHTGPMSGANQALSYLIFFRDKKLFEQKYPDLELVCWEPFHNYLRCLISGGVNFRPLLPNFMVPVLKFVECCLRPISHLFVLHYVFVIRKKAK